MSEKPRSANYVNNVYSSECGKPRIKIDMYYLKFMKSWSWIRKMRKIVTQDLIYIHNNNYRLGHEWRAITLARHETLHNNCIPQIKYGVRYTTRHLKFSWPSLNWFKMCGNGLEWKSLYYGIYDKTFSKSLQLNLYYKLLFGQALI